MAGGVTELTSQTTRQRVKGQNSHSFLSTTSSRSKSALHLAGRFELPLQIETDKKGVISYSLESGAWEISKKRFFTDGLARYCKVKYLSISLFLLDWLLPIFLGFLF